MTLTIPMSMWEGRKGREKGALKNCTSGVTFYLAPLHPQSRSAVYGPSDTSLVADEVVCIHSYLRKCTYFSKYVVKFNVYFIIEIC